MKFQASQLFNVNWLEVLLTIHWDSIVGKANGSWNRKEWTQS